MSDWKSTKYEPPKAWEEQERERSSEEMKKGSSSPAPVILSALGLGLLAAVLIVGAIIWLFV